MFRMQVRHRAVPALLAVVAAAAWAFTGGAATASAAVSSYSGQACALKAQLLTLNEIDLGCATLPSTGGAEQSSLLSVQSLSLVPGTLAVNNLEVFGGHTVGQGNESRSHASVANTSVTVGGHTVTAEFLASRSSVQCGALPMGTSELANVTVDGTPVIVGTAPNTTLVNAAGVTVIANRQTSTSDTIDVAALEISVDGVGTVDIATVHSDIHCTSPAGPPSCPVGNDFITGGGWFTMLDSNKRNFADAAGYKNKGIWGHLVYQDKALNVKVEGDPVWYGPVGINPPTLVDSNGSVLPSQLAADVFGAAPAAATNPRYIVGLLKGGGAYFIRTADGGEPGHGVDEFDIVFLHVDTNAVTGAQTFSTYQGAYAAVSDLTPGISGGNVQLHKPCG
jgi:hypothetical protein